MFKVLATGPAILTAAPIVLLNICRQMVGRYPP
jgi:hypothetical protein